METKQALLEKLFALQGEIGAITKDSTNPFYGSAYFDINKLLEVIKPLAQKHGLLILQPLVVKDGATTLVTSVYEVTGGNVLESSITLPVLNDPQKLGAAITYFRRYSLQSLLCLQAEDDDANTAIAQVMQPVVKAYPQDDKPWLTEDQFKAMKESIAKGEAQLVKERMGAYKMKKVYKDELNALLNGGVAQAQVQYNEYEPNQPISYGMSEHVN